MPYERYNNFNNPQNTTSIDELNDIPDVVSLPDVRQPNVEKFIRPQHAPLTESGMFSQRTQSYQPPPPQQSVHQEPLQVEHFSGCPCTMCNRTRGAISCPMVFEHIAGCPVCQRIYAGKSCDYRMYILIIIILLVICALLFKKAFL